jgi:AcrR family transcriptional regulator
MSGQRIRKDYDERREQILNCARRLFQERSYEQVSTADLAAAAGVSRGLLNHYFGTKRELYLAAVERMLKAPSFHVPAYVAGASVRDRVAESVSAWLDLLEHNTETWLTVLERVSMGGDQVLADMLEESREQVVDRVTEVVGLSGQAAAHPEIRAALRGFAGFAEVVSREWLRQHRLTRDQARILLEGTLLQLVETLIPALVEP